MPKVQVYTIRLYAKEEQDTSRLEENMEAMVDGPASLAIEAHEEVEASTVELEHWFKE